MNIYAGSTCTVCARVARENDRRPYHRCSKCQSRLAPNMNGTAPEKTPDPAVLAASAYAGYRNFWRRLFAGLIDALVLTLLAIPLHVLAGKFGAEFGGLVNVVIIMMYPLYAIVLHSRYGQTLGKAVMQLRVVDHGTQQLISIKRSLLRSLVPLLIAIVLTVVHLAALSVYWLGYTLEFSLYVKLAMTLGLAMLVLAISESGWYLLELVTMLANKRRRALHDFLAGSVVIKVAPTST